jgi:hypothetical protein
VMCMHVFSGEARSCMIVQSSSNKGGQTEWMGVGCSWGDGDSSWGLEVPRPGFPALGLRGFAACLRVSRMKHKIYF